MFCESFNFGQVRSTPIRIIATSCWHIEKRFFIKNPNHFLFQVGAFYHLLKELEKPNTYCLQIGDWFNDFRTTKRKQLAIIENEGRGNGKLSDDDCLDMDFWDRKLIPGLKKIAHKFIGVVRGNHYRRYGNGDTNVDYVCRQSGIKMLGEHRGHLLLRFQRGEMRRSINTFITHGSGGNAKNDLGKLKDQSGTEQASIIFGGHTHRLNADICAIRKTHKDGELKTHAKLYVRCGTLQLTGISGVDDYADLSDYGALPLGFSAIDITPVAHNKNLELRASVSLIPYNFL